MPIVLAIEPDRRQAAHLAAIVRQQVGAELLLAETTEGALDAIGDRVPDLVLASGPKPAAARGVLARWRRSREESPEPNGCDPAVFGEQISAYLTEAAEERAQLEQDLLEAPKEEPTTAPGLR